MEKVAKSLRRFYISAFPLYSVLSDVLIDIEDKKYLFTFGIGFCLLFWPLAKWLLIWGVCGVLFHVVYSYSSSEVTIDENELAEENISILSNESCSMCDHIVQIMTKVQKIIQIIRYICIYGIPIAVPIIFFFLSSDFLFCTLFFALVIAGMWNSEKLTAVCYYSISGDLMNSEQHIETVSRENKAKTIETPPLLRFTSDNQLIDEPKKLKVRELQTKSIKGELFIKFPNQPWKLQFCCIQNQCMYCFDRQEHELMSSKEINLMNYLSAKIISIDEVVKRDIEISSASEKNFLSSGQFFLLVPCQKMSTNNIFLKSVSLEAYKWTQALNDEIYFVGLAPTVIKDTEYRKSLKLLLNEDNIESDSSEQSSASIQQKQNFSSARITLKVGAAKLVSYCLKSGWLYKKVHFVKKKRFCVIHQGWKVLYYFIHEKSTIAQGFIDLGESSKVYRENNEKSFIVYDSTKDRQFFLSADSSDEVSMWIRTLQAVLSTC